MSEEPCAIKDIMALAMPDLIALFPRCAVVLLVTPFDCTGGSPLHFSSNGSREDVLAVLKELIGKEEGRSHAAPALRQ